MHIVLVSPPNWNFPNELSKITSHEITSLHVAGESLDSLSLNGNPDMVFLGGFDSSEDGYFDKVVAMSIANPTWLVVPYLQGTEFTHVLRAMRKGIREILSSVSPDEIAYIIDRARVHATRREKMSERRRELVRPKKAVTRIGIISVKGGDGGTAVTANIAASIAKDKDVRVVVLDLSMELGDLDLYLTTTRPIDNLSSILASIDRLDNTLLKIMVHHCSNQVDLISSPDTMEDVFSISADAVERLIDLLSLHYDVVLIDMGSGLNPIALNTWKKINKLVLVTRLSIPSARRAAQIIALRSRVNPTDSQSYVLINKAGISSDIQKSDFELAIGQNIWKTLPYDEEINNSMLTGASLVERSGNSKFARSISNVVFELTGRKIDDQSFMEALWTTFKNK